MLFLSIFDSRPIVFAACGQRRGQKGRELYASWGTQVAIANGFNGFSVCLVCGRGLFATEQSENNLRGTYVRMYILENYLLHASAVMGVADESVPAPGLTRIAQTVREVDINYSAPREQFIAVITVYAGFTSNAIGEFSRNFAPIGHYYSPLFRLINNGAGCPEFINRVGDFSNSRAN